MRITISGVGGVPLVVSHVKTLGDNDLINISGLCRALGNIPRSSFLEKVASMGLEAAIKHYLNEKRKKTIN
ncbi:TPA: hypothetical protein L9300_002463 [Klebsiella pneumoniae]|uniref:hypothetical protein n=1 Tax=Klebsiella pneumoniae TaxID=573 RepID=UPI00109144D4|nr:hypothetical protein [Klebsiella pneumoniae]VGJ96554.1 Uncharacterised protein [Klebsiella pneumoniae]HBR7318109.1 hypothetical protein [Klebsiella pneumoniae]HBR7323116.1 hypothetical protein [Klebsiella pneumoniae]HBR7334031.1 hypothetical protein [Klebsiella pneumoniae]